MLDCDWSSDVCSSDLASIVKEIIAAERVELHKLLREGKITDETRRRLERDLDLEEAVISNREKNTPL
jgi:CPA1 family monovalent cation:H+ antiporter